MAFDIGLFNQHLMDIERRLGTLKGNELVKEYFQSVADAVPADVPRMGSYSFNSLGATDPPEPDLAVDFMYHLGGRPVVGDGTDAEQQEFLRQLNEGAKQSFDNGMKWASGIRYYLRSIVKPFTLPDVERFRRVANDLRHGIRWVEMGVPDFASNSHTGVNFGTRLGEWRKDGWEGDAAAAFESFYEALAGRMWIYERTCVGAADLVEAVGAQIQAAQSGLIDFVEGAAKALRQQCVQWSETGGHPFSYEPKDLGWVADLAGIGKDIVDAVPVVDKLGRLPENIVETGEKVGRLIEAWELIDKYVDLPEDRRLPRAFTLRTADMFYDDLTAAMYDDLYGGYKKGLEYIEVERSRRLYGQVRRLKSAAHGDWFPPKVANIENEKHW